MAALTMDALKSYCNAGERNLAEGTVLCDVKHNLLTRNFFEIPFEVDMTIEEVKTKIYQMTGSLIDFMVLTLNGVVLQDGFTLGQYYPKVRGDVIHCQDTDPHSKALNGGLEDVSLVQKYVMSEEDYDKRQDTVRAYKRKMLALDPDWKPDHIKRMIEQKAKEKAERKELGLDEDLKQVLARVKIGDRASCAPGDRRGEVAYIGLVPEIAHHDPDQPWIGVRFDEPVGKNDGSKKGNRYFEADPKHGGFLLPHLVKVGDFPADDPFASSDDSDSDLMEEL